MCTPSVTFYDILVIAAISLRNVPANAVPVAARSGPTIANTPAGPCLRMPFLYPLIKSLIPAYII